MNKHCLLGLCWLGVLGCSVGKRSVLREQVSYTDSLVFVRHDSLSLSRHLQASLEQSLRMHHINFSPPNTAGEQYVESVTVVSSAANEAYSEQQSGHAGQEITLSRQYSGEADTHIRTAYRSRPFPYWIGIAAALVLVFIGKIIRRKGG